MKKIFITGGTSKIGSYLVQKFIELEWDVYFHYNSNEKIADEIIFNTKIDTKKIFKFDFNNLANLEQELSAFFENFAPFDVLVNNAGIFPNRKQLDEIDLIYWNQVMNINLNANLIVTKSFCKVANDKYKVINFASLGGLEVWKNLTAYNTSKAAMIQLTKSLARELAPKATVNCICPGTIMDINNKTNMPDSVVPISRIPADRFGNPNDIFEAVNFFATCNDFITGQILSVDGGYHLVR